MDEIKYAFFKVKEDMLFLNEEMNFLKEKISSNENKMNSLESKLDILIEKFNFFTKEIKDKQNNFISTNNSTHNSLNNSNKTDNTTDNTIFKPLNGQNLGISTGNQGVSTDRQTDRQTDISIEKKPLFLEKEKTKQIEHSFEEASELLESLDSLKKELRLKFKRLTNREFLVFSTIYQLDQEKKEITYKTIAKKIGLTESSIRDYVGRLNSKGIPLIKNKLNNKEILLSISPDLHKIASLNTILKLREI